MDYDAQCLHSFPSGPPLLPSGPAHPYPVCARAPGARPLGIEGIPSRFPGVRSDLLVPAQHLPRRACPVRGHIGQPGEVSRKFPKTFLGQPTPPSLSPNFPPSHLHFPVFQHRDLPHRRLFRVALTHQTLLHLQRGEKYLELPRRNTQTRPPSSNPSPTPRQELSWRKAFLPSFPRSHPPSPPLSPALL